MPVFHRGLKTVPRKPNPNCQGHPLDEGHDEVACHAQGEKRNDIIRLLNCWIDSVEKECSVKKKKLEEPCTDYVLCYPEYNCAQRHTVHKPHCIKGGPAALLLPETACFEEGPLWMRDSPPPPVWERPRVKSSQLIAGEFRKIKECFKSNGLIEDHCPRTESCQLMKSMNEMIEADRKLHGRNMLALDCCCRPGDAPSRMPQFKCTHYEPSSQYGYKDMKCPVEIGSHREPCHSHHCRTQLPYHADKQEVPDRHQHGFNSSKNPPVHSYKPLNEPSNRFEQCLIMNNPRPSGEIWKDDLDIFGHHAEF